METKAGQSGIGGAAPNQPELDSAAPAKAGAESEKGRVQSLGLILDGVGEEGQRGDRAKAGRQGQQDSRWLGPGTFWGRRRDGRRPGTSS